MKRLTAAFVLAFLGGQAQAETYIVGGETLRSLSLEVGHTPGQLLEMNPDLAEFVRTCVPSEGMAREDCDLPAGMAVTFLSQDDVECAGRRLARMGMCLNPEVGPFVRENVAYKRRYAGAERTYYEEVLGHAQAEREEELCGIALTALRVRNVELEPPALQPPFVIAYEPPKRDARCGTKPCDERKTKRKK
jgi:hypothetical protein